MSWHGRERRLLPAGNAQQPSKGNWKLTGLKEQRRATDALNETARLREEVSASDDRVTALQRRQEVDRLEAQRRAADADEEAVRLRETVAVLNGRAKGSRDSWSRRGATGRN